VPAGPFISVLAFLGPYIVGGVLFFAGLAKAIDPRHFARHLQDLHMISPLLLVSTTLMLISMQCSLGAALMLSLWPRWLLPTTILSLLVFMVLGYWGMATGRTADCGCYNGALTFSPLQSLLLDIGYIALLLLSWRWTVTINKPNLWKIAIVPAVGIGAGLLTHASFRYSAKHHRPLLELSPLKAGRHWNLHWLQGDAALSAATGKKIIVFLGTNCHYCRRWIKVLNVVHGLKDQPDVIGVVFLHKEDLVEYVNRESIRFPVVTAKPWVMARLARNFTPTAVVVENGTIREKWVGSMPKPFVDRLRATMIPK